MSAVIIDGKKIADQIKEKLKKDIFRLKNKGIVPGLAVILAGDDPASRVYVSNKEKTCQALGINSRVLKLPQKVSQKRLLALIKKLNRDTKIHGILIQLPLPKHLNEKEIMAAVDIKKDVDGFHPFNLGNLLTNQPFFYPCTPAGILELIKNTGISLEGKECVVVGRSNIVGKPLAIMLLNQNATVTIAHSKTKNLSEVCRRADVLISAVGKAGLIKATMVKSGAVVIDVGINRLAKGKLAGDVDFEAVKKIAGFITPVPGGVGPMTIAMLAKNTVKAARSVTKSHV